MTKKFWFITSGLIAGLLVVLGLNAFNGGVDEAEATNKFWICHREPNKQDISLYLDFNGAFNGHIKKHEDDSWGKCPEPEPTPTPTITPSPTPVQCDEVSYTCEECSVKPNDGTCEEYRYKYCSKSYDCHYVDTCEIDNDFKSLKPCSREWVCDCQEPEPTPTEKPSPTPTPEQKVGDPEPSKPQAPSCDAWTPGEVANIYVDRGVPNDNCLEVRWLPKEPTSNKAHIKYTNSNPGEWRYALLDTDNDGVELICGLNNGEHYWFTVAQVNSCAVGGFSSAFDPLP